MFYHRCSMLDLHFVYADSTCCDSFASIATCIARIFSKTLEVNLSRVFLGFFIDQWVRLAVAVLDLLPSTLSRLLG